MAKRYFDLYNKKYHESVYAFDCTDSFFCDYLIYNMKYDLDRGLGTTHLFIEDTIDHPDKILGFSSLRSSSLIIKSTVGNKTQISGYPAIEICQFAVDKSYERMGIGTIMIQNIISMAHETNEKYCGVKYIVLNSREDSLKFYKKMGFLRISDDMMVPTEDWSKKCIPLYLHIKIKD